MHNTVSALTLCSQLRRGLQRDCKGTAVAAMHAAPANRCFEHLLSHKPQHMQAVQHQSAWQNYLNTLVRPYEQAEHSDQTQAGTNSAGTITDCNRSGLSIATVLMSKGHKALTANCNRSDLQHCGSTKHLGMQ